MQMQLASSAAFPEPLLAAMPQLKEKPHMGVPSSNPALHQGHEVCNSTTALGLQAALHLERIRSRSTGKERDAESGNDYFGARYYASSMGRFMSPDWSAKAEPVPYAKLGDPQTLNLYAYVGNNPLDRTDPTGHYDDKCGGGDKKCEKGLNNFDKQNAKDLKSKSAKVRAAAAVWGTRGDHNGIGVKFVTQQQMNADHPAPAGFQADAAVTPGVTADHKLTVNAEFSENLGGSDLGQTIAHEGSHIEDAANFVNSYDAATGNYFSGANYLHRDTEFQAFEAGAGVKAYSSFERGQKGYQQLDDYITKAYPNADQLEWDPARYPQQ
jgi:RHS repeat-associated protein